jgi:hypothetical protein
MTRHQHPGTGITGTSGFFQIETSGIVHLRFSFLITRRLAYGLRIGLDDILSS